LIRCLAFLFPDTEELRDITKQVILSLRRTTHQEKEDRTQSVPLISEKFKKSLLLEIRNELNQRPLSQRSKLSPVPSTREDKESPGEEIIGKRQPSVTLTPPLSPPNKRQRMYNPEDVRRSVSESCLFSQPVSKQIFIPAPISIAKLEQRLIQLEQQQIKFQKEIEELRIQIQSSVYPLNIHNGNHKSTLFPKHMLSSGNTSQTQTVQNNIPNLIYPTLQKEKK